MNTWELDRYREVYDTLLRHRRSREPISDRVYEGMLCMLAEALRLPSDMLRDDLERTRPAETELAS